MMNKKILTLAVVVLIAPAVCASASGISSARGAAGKEPKTEFRNHLQNHFKFYGFIRNYLAFDTRESVAGTGDLYYWIPKDRALNELGEDMNAQNQFRFLSLTSRAGVDVNGYKIGNTEFGAKIEADFYAGISGVTGTAQLRLRQAYLTLKWVELGQEGRSSVDMKMGQAWHPMAADLPDIFSLESGAPFGPFSRTPQWTTDFNLGSNVTLTASLLWQMQYTSSGPEGASANYMKYGLTPELYLGFTYKKGGFLGRVGMDLLSIKPRHTAEVLRIPDGSILPVPVTSKVRDRITTVSPFVYLQYTKGDFKFKAKSVYGSAGEHFNLMSGYAVTSKSLDNSIWEYTPIHSSSTWVTLAYGKKVQGAILLGYIKNLGTSKDIYNLSGAVNSGDIFFQKNGSANINQMYRIQPEITYNVGKFTLGLEYMMTAVQYGDSKYTLRALTSGGLHWVANHRIQSVVKFTF